MTDLGQAIEQVMAEDRGDDGRNMNFLSKARTGVQFMPVIEGDEIVDGCASPPRPATIKAAVMHIGPDYRFRPGPCLFDRDEIRNDTIFFQ